MDQQRNALSRAIRPRVVSVARMADRSRKGRAAWMMWSFLALALVIFILPGAAYAQIRHIDRGSLDAMIAQGAPVIDIRTAPEWKQTGVIEGSHLLTFFDERGQFDLDVWMQEFSKLAGKDDPVVLICAGGVRSAAVAQVLSRRLGYTAVHNVEKGIDDWIQAGGKPATWSP